MDLQIRFSIALSLALLLGACGDDAKDPAGAGEDGGGTGDEPMTGSRLTPDASASDPNTVGDPSGDPIEVAGSWTGDFADEEITGEDWAGATIVEFDNEENFAITQNAEDADFDPGKFNKIVWTEPEEDGFFYCTVVFGLGSAEDALNTEETADDSDPAAGGCGDFPWTQLSPM